MRLIQPRFRSIRIRPFFSRADGLFRSPLPVSLFATSNYVTSVIQRRAVAAGSNRSNGNSEVYRLFFFFFFLRKFNRRVDQFDPGDVDRLLKI